MFDLLTRFRQARHEQRQGRQQQHLSQVDALALARQAPPQPERVLIVRHDSIGDYLLYRPWLRRMAAELHARGQHVTLAANAIWAPLARAWDADVVDELLVVDFGRFQHEVGYRTETLGRLGAGGYGTLFYPPHVREPAVENFVRFLQAPVRISSQGAPRTGSWAQTIDHGYTCLLPTTPTTLFEYNRNQEFFENWLGRPSPTPALHLPIAPADLARFHAALGRHYIVLFPGASARQKRWPASHFARLAQGLHQRCGADYRLVLAGSPDDNRYAQQILAAAGLAQDPAPWLTNLCGHTSLLELTALLHGARLVVSNDTVAAHLAVQAGTPCLTVLLGENYGKFFPYPAPLHTAPSRCLFPPTMEARFAQGNFTPPDFTPKLATVTPARVLAVAGELLAAW